MKTCVIKVFAIILVLAMSVSILSACGSESSAPAVSPAPSASTKTVVEGEPNVSVLSDEQRTKVEILHFIAYVVQRINDSRYSRLTLENYFDSLVNDIEKSNIDESTKKECMGIMETIKQYRLNQNELSRLEFLNNQGSALQIVKVIPNPLSVLDQIHEKGTVQALAGVAYSAIEQVADSEYASEEELKFLERQWALENAELDTLLKSRTQLFGYMVDVENALPKDVDVTLTESDIEEFVSKTNNSGKIAKLDWLKNNQEKYQYFGYYWLELADSCYENGDYEGCLSAIKTYRAHTAGIFNLDKRLAQSLRYAIMAAKEVMSDEECELAVADFVDTIVRNIGPKDWDLRYFAAQMYLDLYGKTDKKDYLDKAYKQAKINVENLVQAQLQQNNLYLQNVETVDIPKGTDSDESKIIKDYNSYMKEQREKALPPVYEPLVLNCDLLFALAEKLDISENEKKVIDDILHNEHVFLSNEMDQRYSFETSGDSEKLKDSDLKYDTTFKEFTIPAVYVPEGTMLKADISSGGQNYHIDDWTVKEVNRNKSNNVNDFDVVFKTSSKDKIKYKEGDVVLMTIIPPGYLPEEALPIIKLIVDKVNILGVQFKLVTE